MAYLNPSAFSLASHDTVAVVCVTALSARLSGVARTSSSNVENTNASDTNESSYIMPSPIACTVIEYSVPAVRPVRSMWFSVISLDCAPPSMAYLNPSAFSLASHDTVAVVCVCALATGAGVASTSRSSVVKLYSSDSGESTKLSSSPIALTLIL